MMNFFTLWATTVSLASAHYKTGAYSSEHLVRLLARGHFMQDAPGMPVEGIPVDFECEWRIAAFGHAKTLQPHLSIERQRVLFEALELGSVGSDGKHLHPVCSDRSIAFEDVAWEPVPSYDGSLEQGTYLEVHSVTELLRVLDSLSVVSESEDSTNLDSGLRTGSSRTIIGLAPGVYRLSETLALGPEHSHVTLRPSQPGSEVTITSARLLSGLHWTKVDTSSYGAVASNEANVYVADVPDNLGALGMTALRVNEKRATRARFPNANPEYDQFPVGYVASKTEWLPPKDMGPSVDVTVPMADAYPFVDTPASARPTGYGKYAFAGAYRVGINGSCSILTPPASYWCQPDGRTGDGYHFRTPSGVRNISQFLPHGPYRDGGRDMVLTYWRPGHWFSIMFNLSRPIDSTTGDAIFGIGGFQGADGHDEGAEWFVENVLEELDSPNEFFHDEARNKLYFYFNGTGAPPPEVEVPMLTELITVRGTVDAPVQGLHIFNLTLEGQRPTYLEPHGIPSAGDWGLERMAAFHFEGTEDLLLQGCIFQRLDGNAVLLAGYNRRAVIRRNEFVLLGASAVALWGDDQLGDGTVRGGEQPRETVVEDNFCHEIGIYQKQSSCYFHAVSAQSTIRRNLFFNGPRALVNFNDGFGGGHDLGHNLLFNSCREGSDHGAFNSWGRQPYLADIRTGSPSAEPAWSRLHNNFIVANYAANGGCFDNDDGSSWYLEQNNFCVYGGMKSDFEGSNKRSSNNVHAFANVYGDACLAGINQVSEHYAEGYWNNTCILAKAGDTYLSLSQLSPKEGTVPSKAAFHTYLGSNTIFVPNASCTVTWGSSQNITEWLSYGLDDGTRAMDSSSLTSAQILQMGFGVLTAPNGPPIPGGLDEAPALMFV
ncbi:unnamed protein product [Polarella glacialis]|uniref:Right handed beta helix domain-containing protein n=1 Tax=Polarella glacialis TaxID=89957 RepID=A0A813HJT3_POLGL|nr:unnamed protein product [Polarella glacialis]